MYNKPQGLLLLLYQELTEYCCNHPVTCNEALNDIINSVLDRNHLWGLRFPEHFMSMYTATIVQLHVYHFATYDTTYYGTIVIVENEVWMKLQGFIFG